ncbi:hypothetical protein [Lacticaseibacillus nasuensis]|uniref:hypothetical protein n=1 Tax=Lacticaseibacillus nasuensis TaxID=944671 RepID=UPI0022454B3F|nr:hypothetical protein [Lacticaseibacillus nasuensis]MCX2455704.1 hypothetical protein [Lacticaseibacillus nasuensis]
MRAGGDLGVATGTLVGAVRVATWLGDGRVVTQEMLQVVPRQLTVNAAVVPAGAEPLFVAFTSLVAGAGLSIGANIAVTGHLRATRVIPAGSALRDYRNAVRQIGGISRNWLARVAHARQTEFSHATEAFLAGRLTFADLQATQLRLLTHHAAVAPQWAHRQAQQASAWAAVQATLGAAAQSVTVLAPTAVEGPDPIPGLPPSNRHAVFAALLAQTPK